MSAARRKDENPNAPGVGTELLHRLRTGFYRREDRLRGSGWLDCPNCREHALQDVVDDMAFACVSIYRLTPVGRRRVLICRRCGFRRAATRDEMLALRTMGRAVHRAVLVPIGLLPIAAALILTMVVVGHSGPSADTSVTYLKYDARPLAPIRFDLPTDFNQSVDVDTVPNTLSATDSSGRIKIKLKRFATQFTPTALMDQEYLSETGINSQCVPRATPRSSSTTVAGQRASVLTYAYVEGGQTIQLTVYTFNHDGVSYAIDGRTEGEDATTKGSHFLAQFVSSLDFSQVKETAAPTATTSSDSGSSSSATGSGSGSGSSSGSGSTSSSSAAPSTTSTGQTATGAGPGGGGGAPSPNSAGAGCPTPFPGAPGT